MVRRSLTGYEGVGGTPIVAGSTARIFSNANQSVPNATIPLVTVALGGMTHNNGSVFDLSVPNQIKVLKAGTYLVTAGIFFEFGNTGQRNGVIRKNAADPALFQIGTVGSTARVGGGDVVRLVAGDFINMGVYIDGGAASQITAGTDNAFLTVSLLEPESGTSATTPAINNAAVTTPAAGFAADTYLAGSSCAIPNGRLQAKAMYRLKFRVSKTAAGTAAPIVTVRIGTAGTTADAARCALTFAAQTAIADSGMVEVFATFRTVGATTTAILHAVGMLDHQLAATGLSTLNTSIPEVTSAGFDSTIANTIIGASVNGGSLAAWTIQMVQAELFNLTP